MPPQPQPQSLGPSGGPLHHMCAWRGDENPHHAQVASQPPMCSRHYDLYTKHQDANRKRVSRGTPVKDFDPGPDAPEDQGRLLLDLDDVDYLVAELLPAITDARLEWLEAPDAKRRLAAGAELDEACGHLLKFFKQVGAKELRARRLAE